jgi:SAM-dependent methyltransferase
MPLKENTVDVVISNCVLNLVPDKKKAFAEIFRVIKPGGHLCVSDVILQGKLPQKLKNDAVMYAGCVAGAIQKEEYLDIVKKAGFSEISIKKEKEVVLPDQVLFNYYSWGEVQKFRKSKVGIYSITLFAAKPTTILR